MTGIRFFPRVLTAGEVEEIYTGGTTKSDIGYIIQPQIMEQVSELEFLKNF